MIVLCCEICYLILKPKIPFTVDIKIMLCEILSNTYLSEVGSLIRQIFGVKLTSEIYLFSSFVSKCYTKCYTKPSKTEKLKILMPTQPP